MEYKEESLNNLLRLQELWWQVDANCKDKDRLLEKLIKKETMKVFSMNPEDDSYDEYIKHLINLN